MFGEEHYYNKMIAAGAKGFILKTCAIDELEKAIHVVMGGKNYFDGVLLRKGIKTSSAHTTKNL